MKQNILIAILAIFTAFSLSAQVINNPSGNTSNNLYSTSICYVNSAPTWNPDVSAASKWCKIAYNEATGEVWYWQTNKVATGNGAWVSASIITRMASNSAPSHTPPNPAEIVILPNGTLYTWNGSAWATVGGSGSTNLTTTTAPTTVTVNSDTGTDAIIPAATTSNAGVMTATDKTNLNSVVTNSHVPVTVTDGSKIDFTLTGQDLTATIIPASIANTDLSASGAASGQVLKFNGTSWVPAADSVGSVGSTNLTGGTQIAITNGTGAVIGSSPVTLALAQNGATTDQAMIWNGAAWGPGSIDATAIPYSPTTPLTSTDVQGAIDQLALSIGGGASSKDSTFSKLNGSYVGKNLWSNVYRNGTTSFRGVDTTGLVTIGRRAGGWNITDRPMIALHTDTSAARNIFLKIGAYKNSPYTYAPFGLVSENVLGQPGGYGDYVWSFGPNCGGNSGVSLDATKPTFAVNWETSWNDGGVPTMEWHEHWKIPDSSAVRLKSYTIKYPNATNPSRETNIDLYHTADQFSVKAGTYWNGFPSYWSVGYNRVNKYGSMGLSFTNDASMLFSGVKSGAERIAYIACQHAGAGAKSLQFTNWDEVLFGGGGGQDRYTTSTRELRANILTGMVSISGTKIFTSNGLGSSTGIYGTSNQRMLAISNSASDIFLGVCGPTSDASWMGSNCTAIGLGVMGNSPTTAKRVVGIGAFSNAYTRTSEGVVAIGAFSNRLTENTWGLQTKTIAIGDSCLHNPNFNPTGKLVIEASPSNTPLISGDFNTNKVGINIYQAAPTVTLDINGTDAVKITSGTTGQRPPGINGLIRHNSIGEFEGVASSGTWSNFIMGWKGTATLDFSSTAAQTSSTLTITVTGASVGDLAQVTPVTTEPANSSFTARVTASNTVTVKFNNYSSGAIDPDAAGQVYNVIVTKF